MSFGEYVNISVGVYNDERELTKQKCSALVGTTNFHHMYYHLNANNHCSSLAAL